MDVGNLISGSSDFSKSRLYIWKFSVHTLLKPNSFLVIYNSAWMVLLLLPECLLSYPINHCKIHYLAFLCFLRKLYGYGFYIYAFNTFLYIMWDKDLTLFFCMYISSFPVTIFFSFIFISWRPITLQYCSCFCHTLTWISHGFTCVSHPDSPSCLPLHPIPLGLPSAPALSTCLMHPTWADGLFHPW